MGNTTTANFLKSKRKELKMSVNYVLERLEEYGIIISSKTLYGWESGNRSPTIDSFMALCRIYGVEDVRGIAPERYPMYVTPESPISREFRRFLNKLGYFITDMTHSEKCEFFVFGNIDASGVISLEEYEQLKEKTIEYVTLMSNALAKKAQERSVIENDEANNHLVQLNQELISEINKHMQE